jgi:hypothetical protein
MTPFEAVGYLGASVLFDGTFITIRRKGFNRLTVGKGEKRIPVRSVTAVQFKPAGPMVNGFIQFSLGGGNEARSRFGRQTVDAVNDENSVIFTRKQQGAFTALRDMIDAAVAAGNSSAPAATIDPMDQLRKLADLRDSGVVTEAEFQAKKRQLLGS